MKWLLILVVILVVLIAIIYLIGYMMEIKHSVTIERRFKATVDEVWQFLINFKGYTSWRTGIKELTVDGEDRWTEVNNHGDRVSYEMKIVVDKKRLTTKILNKNLPYGGFWELDLTQLDDECLLRITENGEVYNPFFRFMSKFIFGHEGTIRRYLTDLQAKLPDPQQTPAR